MNKILSTKVQEDESIINVQLNYENDIGVPLPEKRRTRKMALKGMRFLRKTKEYALKENIRRTRQKVGHSFSDAVNKFREALNSSCSFVCSCCQQTWFKHSVQAVASLNIKSLDAKLLDKCLTGYISVGDW